MILAPGHNKNKNQTQRKKRISILGSTGSIGCSALELVRKNPGKFEVILLSANSNYSKLAEQIAEFNPSHAIICSSKYFDDLKAAIPSHCATEIFAGDDTQNELLKELKHEIVLAAITGFAGLKPVLTTLEAGIPVALANKESLVSGAELVKRAITKGSSWIVPVDSEHSALFQLLESQCMKEVNSLTLTASGGPFFRTPVEEFKKISPEAALKHPKWSMGPKISIDSATMFNKALELIEAFWLFGVAQDKIKVLVHPQSIVHSLINFNDGTSFAHLSVPDMKGPISYALAYPEQRVSGAMQGLDLSEISELQFYPIDHSKFPAIELARQALKLVTNKASSAACAVLNAANEKAVELFLKGQISFDKINSLVSSSLEQFATLNYASYEDLLEIDILVREKVGNRDL